jgi:hypothetical protein
MTVERVADAFFRCKNKWSGLHPETRPLPLEGACWCAHNQKRNAMKVVISFFFGYEHPYPCPQPAY